MLTPWLFLALSISAWLQSGFISKTGCSKKNQNEEQEKEMPVLLFVF
jgi:hypothetical protein